MTQHGTQKPKFSAALGGNVNQAGIASQPAGQSFKHPGTVTRGPGANKPRIHLVSSKGKVPAAVYAEAIALRQKNQAANAANMPAHHHEKKTNPNVGGAHTSMPNGVKGYDVTPKTGLT